MAKCLKIQISATRKGQNGVVLNSLKLISHRKYHTFWNSVQNALISQNFFEIILRVNLRNFTLFNDGRKLHKISHCENTSLNLTLYLETLVPLSDFGFVVFGIFLQKIYIFLWQVLGFALFTFSTFASALLTARPAFFHTLWHTHVDFWVICMSVKK